MTIRVLSDSVPAADWVAFAMQHGHTVTAGNEARLQFAAESAPNLTDAPEGHGSYTQVSNGRCGCSWCLEAWRQARGRYRRTGTYRATP